MDEKGVLLRLQEKDLSVIVDDAIKAKGILELVDGYLARVLITVVDDQVVDKLKTALKEKLAVVVTKALAKDIEGAEVALVDLANSYVDIPVLDEDAEGLIFLGAVQMIDGAVRKWLEKLKAEKA
jgi:hypothetical protein